MQYIVPGIFACAAALWSVIVVRRWAPAARRRGGVWTLEALVFICGPVTTLAIAYYPTSGELTGPFPMINRVAGYVAVALCAVSIAEALKNPRRHAGWLIAGVLLFYLALLMSALGGVVPAFPEAYWTTPLVVLAFVLHGGYSRRWLLQQARIAVRVILLLSLAAAIFTPIVAFNLEEARTVFGIHRLQGITGHPNGLAALLGFGFLLEIHAKSRLFWKLLLVAGIVLAQSTTGYIALLVGLLVMKTGLGKLLRVSIFAALVLAVMAAIAGNGDWLATTFLPEKVDTLTGRTSIWAATLFGFQLGPVWGYGPTLLNSDYRQQYLPNFDAAAQAHNQLVQTLGGEGAVGAVSLVILASVLIVAAVRTRRDTGGLSVALVLFLVTRCITETPLRPSGIDVATLMVVVILGLLATSLSELGPKIRPGMALPPLPGRPKPSPRTAGKTLSQVETPKHLKPLNESVLRR